MDTRKSCLQQLKEYVAAKVNNVKKIIEDQTGDIEGISTAMKIMIAIVIGLLFLGLCTFLVRHVIASTSNNVSNLMDANYDAGELVGIEPGMIRSFFQR